jgi:hypothetical protein
MSNILKGTIMAEQRITLYDLSKVMGVTYQSLRTQAALGYIKAEQTVIQKTVLTVSDAEAQRLITNRKARLEKKAAKTS